MRTYTDALSFIIPPGFTDVTAYSFVDPHEKRVIDVTGGSTPSNIISSDELFAERRLEIKRCLPCAIFEEERREDGIAGSPTRFILLRFVRGQHTCVRWAMALTSSETYVQIGYTAPCEDHAASGWFGRMVRSASLSAERTHTSDDWTRHWAGHLWLDVPAHFNAPRIYQYLSADEEIRVDVSRCRAAHETDSDSSRKAAHGGTLRERSSRTVNTDRVVGTIRNFTSTRLEYGLPVESLLKRASITVDQQFAVQVDGTAPPSEANALDAAFEALMRSIRTCTEPRKPPGEVVY